jgi:hypothetical protein
MVKTRALIERWIGIMAMGVLDILYHIISCPAFK